MCVLSNVRTFIRMKLWTCGTIKGTRAVFIENMVFLFEEETLSLQKRRPEEPKREKI